VLDAANTYNNLLMSGQNINETEKAQSREGDKKVVVVYIVLRMDVGRWMRETHLSIFQLRTTSNRGLNSVKAWFQH
jgi:hypothetical protein